MKAIHANQETFIEALNMFEAWNEKFDYLISLSDLLPLKCPSDLFPYHIEFCQSRTCFTAWIEDGLLRVAGWSNTPVQRGLIVSLIEIVDSTPADELQSASDVYFHEKSGLINNLTPLRKAGLMEMIKRILVLCQAKCKE